MPINIDVDFPLPSCTYGFRYKEHRVAAAKMEVGNSILCYTKGEAASMVQVLKKLGRGYASKRTSPSEGVGKAYRVWRIS